MTDKKRILVVDDSANEIRLLIELLKTDYAVIAATSGEKALELMEGEHQPDLVLLDVTMAPMDGYETCTQLLAKRPHLPIIFISANTHTEEILKGFHCGGMDYITKPVDPTILTTKIKIALQQIVQQQTLQAKRKEATALAKSAMTNASDLAVILNFLRNGVRLKDEQVLAENLISSVKAYELECCVQLRTDQHTINLSSGLLQPLEQELLTRSANMHDRLIATGKRLIISYESISLLIKNMPIENAKRCGELRDYLTSLTENAHNLNIKITSENLASSQRHEVIASTLIESQQTLEKIQLFQHEHKQNSIKIMDEMVTEIETNYLTLGLNEEQENTITTIIQKSVQNALEHMEQGLKIDADLQKITQNLGKLGQM
jgi:hypothetical protein